MAVSQAQASDFEAAQRCYSELLERLPSSTLTSARRAFHLANRAFVRVKLGYFTLALADADAALSLQDRRPTTFWRKVQALDGLERTHQADVRKPAPLRKPRPLPPLHASPTPPLLRAVSDSRRLLTRDPNPNPNPN